jgi:hypothetical protein
MEHMKTFAWISGLGLLLAAAGGNAGCTVSVTSSDGGDDSGLGFGQETSTTPETGTQPETGTSPDSGTTPDASTKPDVGMTPDAASAADSSDAGSCAIFGTYSFGSMACDQCLADHCCNESTACFTGAESDCESKVSCWRDCVVGDAGTTTTCKSDCEGPDAMASSFDAWETCYQNNCVASCQ